MDVGMHSGFVDRVHMRDGWLWPREDRWAWELSRAEFPGLREKLLKYVKSNTRMVQAGGCCGLYPRQWEKDFQVVYTFEPDPLNFYCLSVNCPSNRIVKLQAALGNERGFCGVMERAKDNVGGHMIRVAPKDSGQGSFPILAVDVFNFDEIGAIQLDCEGCEGDILAGATETIGKYSPVICIGTDDPYADRMLSKLGYEQVDQHGGSPPNPPDRIFVYAASRKHN